MKSVLISIQPKWVGKIANGKKTIEVRKTRPKIKEPFKCYIYCTQGDALAYPSLNIRKFNIQRAYNGNPQGRLLTAKEREESDYLFANGKVIGEFVCDKIYTLFPFGVGTGIGLLGELASPEMFCEKSCLTEQEIFDYIGEKDGYGWHISNLKIYDKPKGLSEFWSCKGEPITRAFQSWGYINV